MKRVVLFILLAWSVAAAQGGHTGGGVSSGGLTNVANSLPAGCVLYGNTYPDVLCDPNLTTDGSGNLTFASAKGPQQTATSDATAPVAHEAMKWVATNGWTLATTTDGANPSLTIANANAASSLVRPELPGSQISAVFDGYSDGTGSSSTTVGHYALLSTHTNGYLTDSTTCPGGTMSFGTWAVPAAAGTRTLNYLPRMCVPNEIRHCAITVGDGVNAIATGDMTPIKQGFCQFDYPVTLVEVQLWADQGTTSILLEKRHGASTLTDAMSGALAANGTTKTCVRTTTSATCYNGTTSDNTLTVNTTAGANVGAAGDMWEVKSGTAAGGTLQLRVVMAFTIN